MDLSIGEFARRSGLSPKALRLYDELGLLPPARVDAECPNPPLAVGVALEAQQTPARDVPDGDSDGPIEWCRPIPGDAVTALAARFPELTLRTEAAHTEAFVNLGLGDQIGPAHWRMASESLRAWAGEHGTHPSELGARVTFLANPPIDEGSVPDCDIAVPVT